MSPLPIESHTPRGSTHPGCAWLVALSAAGVLYGLTVAPGLLWGDPGEAQLHVLMGGWLVDGEIVRAHVVYYALARLLHGLLPVTPALAANLAAALCGALTVANFAYLAAKLSLTRIAVFVGTALLMLSHTLWQLSVGAEVITASTALLTAEIIFLVTALGTGRLRWLGLALLANGLGVSNHNFALLMWPVYLVVGLRWRACWQGRSLHVLLVAGGCLVAGMVPVLILCVDDLLTHGSVSHTLESFLVGHYGAKVSNLGRLPVLFAHAAGATLLNFPTPVLLLVIPGLVQARRRWAGPTWWVLLGAGLIYTAFGARYDVPDQHTFLVPAFVFVALFTAVGADHLIERKNSRAVGLIVCLLALLAPMAYALAPPILRGRVPESVGIPTRAVPYRDPLVWFLRPWRCGYDGPERFAREVLEALPKDAWLVVDSTVVRPLNYLQADEALRRDVRLDCWAARQDWFGPEGERTASHRRVKYEAGLLFATSNHEGPVPKWLREWEPNFEPAGFVFRVVEAQDLPTLTETAKDDSD